MPIAPLRQLPLDCLVDMHTKNSNLHVMTGKLTNQRNNKMKYKVHRLDIDSDSMQSKLELYLNELNGEVITVIPNYAKTSLSQIYGIKSKIDFILIVERLN